MRPPFGFLIIDKPPGKTSRDVVNVVQRLVRPVKVGHAGTLDPLATGVLVVCLGPATRLVPIIQEGKKHYQATFRLGLFSETDDIEVEPHPVPDAPTISLAEIEQVLPEFVGTFDQVPPAHSAVHVDGQRAYKLARQGEAPDLAARPVTVHDLTVARFDFETQQLECDITCASGTYIRSLGRDIARRLGTSAVMTGLRRQGVGPFSLQSAIGMADLTAESLRDHIIPTAVLFANDPLRIDIDSLAWEEIRHGRGWSPRAPFPFATTDLSAESRVPLLFDGQLVAMAYWDADHQQIRPRTVFPVVEPS